MTGLLLGVIEARWSAWAATFDDEPDHGLRDPAVRAAWDRRLRSWLPDGASEVADLGCGTGSLAVLAASHGHRVTGVDLSPAMVEGRWQVPQDDAPVASDADADRLRAALPWTGGVRAVTLREAVARLIDRVEVHDLTDDDDLWGRHVTDERYALVAVRP